MNRGIYSIAIALLMASCMPFTEGEIQVDELPTVQIENLVEIKERPVLDAYGFQKVNVETREAKVRRNESLYIILSNLDVTPQTIYALEQESKGKFRTNRIQPGQRYITYVDTETNKANRLILHNNMLDYVVFDWSDGISVENGRKEITKEITETSGIISSSLYDALVDNGDNPLLGNKLSEIFGWQVDFFTLYKNDSFKVIFEQEYVDGEPYGVGNILAAEFTHKGETYDAFFFETEDRAGYFDSKGNGVQKALLRVPFTYSQRISSGFSHSRFHPVLKQRMPHYGVDYAAPLGTPVISVGDGVVVEAQRRGANGNIVQIQHNSTYKTAYLHLNGFASGIRKGVKVKQGQVIGYVGKTGRVTGVHLDYRIYKNGQPVNPLGVELPPSEGISRDNMADFKIHVQRYQFQLDKIPGTLLASN